MSISTKINGSWKQIYLPPSVKVSNSWRRCRQVYVKVGGTWRPLYQYSWSIGSWGSCSVDCGGGTQSRSVSCRTKEGYVVSDDICTTMVGPKPSTSTSCNTQSCVMCLPFKGGSTWYGKDCLGKQGMWKPRVGECPNYFVGCFGDNSGPKFRPWPAPCLPKHPCGITTDEEMPASWFAGKLIHGYVNTSSCMHTDMDGAFELCYK